MRLAKYMEDNIKQADDRARELYEYNEYMDERYPRSAPREPQEERDEKEERARARVEAELIAAREEERQAESKRQTQNKGQTKKRAKEKQSCPDDPFACPKRGRLEYLPNRNELCLYINQRMPKSWLKALCENGWHWNKYWKCWIAKNSERTSKFAQMFLRGSK